MRVVSDDLEEIPNFIQLPNVDPRQPLHQLSHDTAYLLDEMIDGRPGALRIVSEVCAAVAVARNGQYEYEVDSPLQQGLAGAFIVFDKLRYELKRARRRKG